MDRGTGDRGVSEVVGFILIFGMLVTAFTVYQGIVVPDQNRQVEFQHNQEVQGQLQDLRNAIVSTAATDSGQAVSITLGASYPTRALAMNLGVSAGSLQTTGGGEVVLHNVSSFEDETADYVNGSVGPFHTTSIRYTPVYSFYTEAPSTRYENSLVYNRFDGANLTLTDQMLVDGRTLTIATVSGNLSASQQGTVSVNTRPISVSSNRVPITSNGSGPVTVMIPTELSAAQWREILDEEYDPSDTDPDAFVTAVNDAGPNSVALVFEPNVNYGLRLARIGVGDGAANPTPHYLTTVSGNGSTVKTDGQQHLIVEVRDRYNNPVTGAEVNVTGPAVPPTQLETGAGGQATYTFDAPPTPGSESVTMNISGSPMPREEVTFSVNVEGAAGGGGGGGAIGVSWDDPTGPPDQPGTGAGCDDDSCTWDVSSDTDNRLALAASTTPSLDGLAVDFALEQSDIASITDADSETSGGTAAMTLLAQENGTVDVYVSSGGASDVLTVEIENVIAGPEFDGLSIADDTGGGFAAPAEFDVSYSIDDPNSRFKNVTVVFENQDSPGTSETVSSTSLSDTLSHNGFFAANDDYTITTTVYDVDGNAVDIYTCSETADGTNECGTLV